MAYERKTHDVWAILQKWDDEHDWEEVCASDSKVEAQSLLVDYAVNQPEIPVMLVRKRVKNETATE